MKARKSTKASISTEARRLAAANEMLTDAIRRNEAEELRLREGFTCVITETSRSFSGPYHSNERTLSWNEIFAEVGKLLARKTDWAFRENIEGRVENLEEVIKPATAEQMRKAGM